eukprot:c19784_g1_i1.p1 GENE.c19784_g1_i1~~c19784_g1_i1.p1  ORF type:complete len:188 (-),score=-7.24 c19784_g1_i1:174-737(-)
MNQPKYAPLISYDKLKEALPERFKLENLDSIFESWYKEFQLSKKNPNEITNSFKILYIYDNLTYFSTIYTDAWFQKGKENRTLSIKLANNGFIYPREAELNTIKSNITRHHDMGWAELNLESHQGNFTQILNFIKSVIGENVVIQLFYNYSVDRMDVKGYNKETGLGVCVSFEPGYPEDDLADLWNE